MAGDSLVYTLLGINKLSRPVNEAGEDVDKLATKLDNFGKSGAKALGLVTAAGVGSGVAAGAAVAGLTLLFGMITGLLVANNAEVRGSFSDLGHQVSTQMMAAAAPVAPFYTRVAGELSRTANQLNPLLTRAFVGSAPHVLTLTRGVSLFALNAMPGFVRSIERAGPVMLGFQDLLGDTGSGLGGFFDELSKGSADSGTVLTGFGQIMQILLPAVGTLLTQLAAVAAANMDEIVAAVGNLIGIFQLFSGGALPLFAGALTIALNVLDGIVQVLGPFSGVLGAVVVGVLALNMAFRATGAIRGVVSSVDAALSSMAARMGDTTKAAAGTDAAVASMATGMATADKAAAGAEKSSTSWGKRLGGLVGVLGGPLGLVIGAVTVGLGLLGAAQASTAEATAAHTTYVDALTESLRDSSGVIDANARSTAASNSDVKAAIEAAKAFGISQSDVVDSVLGQGSALDELRPKLQAIIDASKEYAVTEGDPNNLSWTGTYTGQGQAAADLLGKINGLNKGTGEAKTASEDFGASMQSTRRSMLDTTAAGGVLAGAVKVLEEKSSSAESRMRALKDIMDALAGQSLNAADAEAELNGQLIQLGELSGTGTDRLQGWGDSLAAANGKIDTMLPNGQKLYSTLRQVRDDTIASAQATHDLAVHQGESLPVALDKARAVMQRSRDAVIETGVAMGMSRERAAAMADQMGLLPDQVSIAINTPFMSATQRELTLLKSRVDQVPGQKSITVDSLSEDARKKLVELGYTVTTLPNGQVRVESNTDPAWAGLREFTNKRSIKYVDVVTVINRGSGGGMYDNYHGNILRFARGGLFGRMTPFAAGRADVFGPNTWRVTGDRPDVPESYIPHNRAPRSMSILETTARAMGRQLMPPGGAPVTPMLMAGGGGTAMSVVINVSGAQSPTGTAQEIRRVLLELRRDLGGAALAF